MNGSSEHLLTQLRERQQRVEAWRASSKRLNDLNTEAVYAGWAQATAECIRDVMDALPAIEAEARFGNPEPSDASPGELLEMWGK